MKIQVVRTGGFMGGSSTTVLECSQLPKDKDQEIRSLVKSMDLNTLPSKFVGHPDARDIYFYRMTIVEDTTVHTVQMDDEADVPAPLWTLLFEVMELGAMARPSL